MISNAIWFFLGVLFCLTWYKILAIGYEAYTLQRAFEAVMVMAQTMHKDVCHAVKFKHDFLEESGLDKETLEHVKKADSIFVDEWQKWFLIKAITTMPNQFQRRFIEQGARITEDLPEVFDNKDQNYPKGQ